MDKNNHTLLATYTIPGNESALYAQLFINDVTQDKFILQDADDPNSVMYKHNPKNLSINLKGELIEIKANLFQSKVSIEMLRKTIITEFENNSL